MCRVYRETWPRHGGRDSLPVAFDPTVLSPEARELPLFLQQVLLVNPALGLMGLTEADGLAAWPVLILPDVREAS